MEGLCRTQSLNGALLFGFPHLTAFAPQEGLLQDLSFSPSLLQKLSEQPAVGAWANSAGVQLSLSHGPGRIPPYGKKRRARLHLKSGMQITSQPRGGFFPMASSKKWGSYSKTTFN